MQRIVLRRNVQGHPSVRVVSTENPNEFSLDVEEVSSEELLNLRRDETFVQDAEPMPTRMIAPLTGASAAAGTAAAGPPAVSWGIAAVGAYRPDWSELPTGAGVTVAVLDTGIDQNHPAFKNRGVEIVTKNFTKDSEDEDIDGHGTHCAGTIFGRDVDGCRIGVATGVGRALVGKVLGRGGGTTDAIFKGILWAIQNDAHVISLSLEIDYVKHREKLKTEFGYTDTQATAAALVDYGQNVLLFEDLSQLTGANRDSMRGVVVTAATGNASKRPQFRVPAGPPSAADLFLAVGSVGPSEDSYVVSKFSNSRARFVAPGEDVWSARRGGGLSTMSGTSMATPHVAGVAALWAEKLMKRRGFRASQVIRAMEKAAIDLSAIHDPADVGAGLVQAPQPL
jgi:subtilisin family serine protease